MKLQFRLVPVSIPFLSQPPPPSPSLPSDRSDVDIYCWLAGCRSSELSHRHPHNDRPTDWLTDWLIAHLQEATPFSTISASLVAVGLLAPTAAAAAAALMRITLLCKGRKCIAVTHRKAFLSFVSGDEGAMKVEDAENQYTTIYTSI